MEVSTDTGGNSAAVSSGSVSESTAPTTFAEADWASDASPAPASSEPATTPAGAEPPAAASEVSPQVASTDERSPFIPRARFDEVNTQKNDLQSKLQQLAWAEQVNPQEFQQIQRIARHFASGDKLAGLNELLTEIRREDPAFETQLRSHAAKILGQRSQQTQADTEPEFMVPQADGSLAFDAQAFGQWKQWQSRQLLSTLKQEFQPVTQTIEQLQAERKAEAERTAAIERQQQIDQQAATEAQDAKTWPGMDSEDNRREVIAFLEQTPMTSDDPREVSLALAKAYRAVVLPKLTQQAQAKHLDSLKKKATDAISVNPGSAAPSSPRQVTRFDQLGADAWR